ncbi:hypothetical protein BHE74_00049001 [Ensete ventricosum]|nr:hypothetical protein GW17_00049674 [Ensete ventricosum]RWW45182.1 hypothetical protein BHE74_00049001 [Ensete ventricosum]RZS21286.1 hypothetical protein BHM03_00053907 [Ensete ventricosum]
MGDTSPAGGDDAWARTARGTSFFVPSSSSFFFSSSSSSLFLSQSTTDDRFWRYRPVATGLRADNLADSFEEGLDEQIKKLMHIYSILTNRCYLIKLRGKAPYRALRTDPPAGRYVDRPLPSGTA